MSLTNDISLLPLGSLTDHTLTSHIASRFHQGMPYVSISTGTLVAINTFSPFDINQEQNFKDMSARAYNRLCKRGENQVIIFLGETGSGKSDFRDCLTSHLLSTYCFILIYKQTREKAYLSQKYFSLFLFSFFIRNAYVLTRI